MDMSERIRQVREQVDNGREPTAIRLRPVLGGEPVIRFEFGRDTVDFPLSDATDVEGEPEALEPGTMLVRFLMAGRRSDVVDCVSAVYLFHGFHDRELDTGDRVIAEYTSVSDGYVNETTHPREHLARSYDDPMRFFLFGSD